MVPSQTLDQATILIVDADRPLTAGNFDCGIVTREMELGQKDLCGYFFGSSCLALQ